MVTKKTEVVDRLERFLIDNKSVMQRAWQDYKVKKAHKGYEEWTFAESLRYSHRTIKALRKNGNVKI